MQGGAGGNGCISFRRERYLPRGGPNGGDGGSGGAVYIVGDSSLVGMDWFLYKKEYAAGRGGHGSSNRKTGRRGEDLVLGVPLGTCLYQKRDEARVLLAEVLQGGQKVLVARGGDGGKGNARFASSTLRAPRLAEKGDEGEQAPLTLELRLPCDVAIIGPPNSGKSSLLTTVSGARPKIAEFPFSTKEPVLGVVEIGYRSITFAELPPLVEGAHEGHGLGNQFLRHAERAKAILLLLDGSSQDLLLDYDTLLAELGLYSQDLLKKTQLVAINKRDLLSDPEKLHSVEEAFRLQGVKPIFVSVLTGEGIPELLAQVAKELPKGKEASPSDKEPARPPIIRLLLSERVAVKRDGDTFAVNFRPVERLAALANLRDRRVRLQLRQQLDRVGISKQLLAQGVKPGDRVRIGQVEIIWE
ncbi:MAG: GTPase ObgE [Chloroflexi bacterium]|nr:GTPase ObgE [Chloroflexota bacterium]